MSQVTLEGEYCHILMPLSGQRIQSFLGYGTGSIARSCPRQPLPLLLSSLSDPAYSRMQWTPIFPISFPPFLWASAHPRFTQFWQSCQSLYSSCPIGGSMTSWTIRVILRTDYSNWVKRRAYDLHQPSRELPWDLEILYEVSKPDDASCQVPYFQLYGGSQSSTGKMPAY